MKTTPTSFNDIAVASEPEPTPAAVYETPTEINNIQPTRIIKNAQGHDVPIYAEGPDDFITGKKTFTDAKLAYENIELSRDPNVEKVFKFNEQEGMGWLTYYDMVNKEEVKGKGSVHNIEQVFPFTIDKEHSLVSTVLEETYPMILTDETPSEEIKNEYVRLRQIEAQKEEE